MATPSPPGWRNSSLPTIHPLLDLVAETAGPAASSCGVKSASAFRLSFNFNTDLISLLPWLSIDRHSN